MTPEFHKSARSVYFGSPLEDVACCAAAQRRCRQPIVPFRCSKKNTAQIVTLFALGNLWMTHRQLMGAQG